MTLEGNHPKEQAGFTEEERCSIQSNLNLKLGPEYISFRSGAGNSKLTLYFVKIHPCFFSLEFPPNS
jgi:recombination DNA repair RAD52 pathway protein